LKLTLRVPVNSNLINWACERSGKSKSQLISLFPKLDDWKTQIAHPTLKQLEKFAKSTRTPIGYFFLEKPPIQEIAIPDLRTVRNKKLINPSPNLTEIIGLCVRRQEWYRAYAIATGEPQIDFASSVSVTANIEETATAITKAVGFDLSLRNQVKTWADALRLFVESIEQSGVLVMTSGVVGNDNTRKLNPDEFRGFALVDSYAPLIFVNGSDYKTAQIFTLAHELAHIWLGLSGISNFNINGSSQIDEEVWCNKVAAEILVPLKDLEQQISSSSSLDKLKVSLTKRYKVSTAVVLRRLFDVGFLSKSEFEAAFQEDLAKFISAKKSSGGNFFATVPARASKRFSKAIISSTLEGKTLFREAYSLLGLSKRKTFTELAKTLGVGDKWPIS